jgi:RimJ/RimL family protein N-acetyltransferase
MVRYIGDGRPWSASRTLDYLESQRAHLEARGYCHWKLVLRETGALVGLCGLNRCLDGDDDVGWWIARELWGRGLATEAARAALADAFGRLGLRRIVATTRSANVAAVRVMEKVGMRLLKRVPAEDLVLYELRHRRTWRRLWGHQFTAG